MLKLTATGNLGGDAENRDLSGHTYTCFKIAENEVYKDKQTGEKKTKTTWISCVKYGDNAGLLPYLKKGQRVYIEGEVYAKAYQDQQGQTVAGLNCRVSYLELQGALQAKQQDNGPQYQQPQNFQQPQGYQPAPQPAQQRPAATPINYTQAELTPQDDDLPF